MSLTQNKRLFASIVLAIAMISHGQAQPELWGLIDKGGSDDLGTIIKVDITGAEFEKRYEFLYDAKGINPRGSLVDGGNGLFYGVTEKGGDYNEGLLFSFDPLSGTYDKILDFESSTTGKNPNAGLMKASNGLLYGMTTFGGDFDMGVLYEFDPQTGIMNTLKHLNGTELGAIPYGGLTEADDGDIYGMTSAGGNNDLGVIFRYDPDTDSFSKIYNFNSTVGSAPYGRLTKANGKLYGLTSAGGLSDDGTLFVLNPLAATVDKLLDFNGGDKGGNPFGSLLLASDGMLYGMTWMGGSFNMGVLFQYDPVNEVYAKKFNFNGVVTGKNPFNGLMQASDGNLYGLTYLGGSHDKGTIFRYNPITEVTVRVHSFVEEISGSIPQGALIEGPGQQLYGLALMGGISDEGTLYTMDLNTSDVTKLLDFNGMPGGSLPASTFIQKPDGKMLATTTKGGDNNQGVLFEYDPYFNEYNKLHDFDRFNTGSGPTGRLLYASDNTYYGTTEMGGPMNNGVLFQFDPVSGNVTRIKNFIMASTGKAPTGPLVEHGNGRIYGTTRNGGTKNAGVLFEFDPLSLAHAPVHDFDSTEGINPSGGLVLASHGLLYGVAEFGGFWNKGSIFSYDPVNDVFQVVHECQANNLGINPAGTMIQASDGLLYGMTSRGGPGNQGVIFSLDPTTLNYEVVTALNTVPGDSPMGSLAELSDGNLYAFTQMGGSSGVGTLIRIDPAGPTLTTLHELSPGEGIHPTGAVIEIEKCPVALNIDQQPADVVACEEGTASFLVDVSGTGPLHFQWYKDGNPVGEDENILTFDPVAMDDGGVFYVEVSDNCATISSETVNLEVNPLSDGGDLTGGTTVCETGNNTTLSLSGNTGNIIRWESSIDAGSTWDAIPVTAPAYTAVDLIMETQYRVVVKNGVCDISYSNVEIIEVDKATNAGTIEGAGPVCSGVNSTTLTLTGYLGGILKWQYKPVAAASWTDITHMDPDYLVEDLIESTEFRAVVKNGSCNEKISDPVLVEVDENTVAGSITGGGTVCGGVNETILTLAGNNGEVVNWQSSVDNGSSWTDIDHFENSYTAADLLESTQFRVEIKNGVCDPEFTEMEGVTVDDPSDGGLLSGDQVVCSNGNTNEMVLTGHTGDIVDWEASVDGGLSWTGLGITASTHMLENVTSETLVRVKVINGVCEPAFSNNVTILVDNNITWYMDEDGDGFGDPDNVINDCDQPDGTVSNPEDCNDNDPDVYPGAPALADGKDNDCDGTIDKIDQSITFDNPGSVNFSQGSFSLSATATSGLGVIFSTDSDRITIDGNTVTILEPGPVTIIASQPGDEFYNAAPETERTFCIIPPAPVITATGSNDDVELSSSTEEGNRWYLDGEILPGETGEELIVEIPGIYAVQVIIDGCESDMSKPFEVEKFTAEIEIEGLVQTYDGTPKTVQVSTDPSGLNFTITYDGENSPPVNAGSYEVIVLIDDDVYLGTLNAILEIEKAEADVEISNLEHIYDGELKEVEVSTEPEGLEVEILYDGEVTPPVEEGAYEVVVTIVDGNYTGSGEATLVIGPSSLENSDISNQVSVYPNPTVDGNVHISMLDGWLDFQVDIYNSRGQLLNRVYNTKSLDLNGFDGNMFLLHIHNDDQHIVKKVFRMK